MKRNSFYQHFSERDRLKAVKLILEEAYSIGQVARQFGVERKQIRTWLQFYQAHGVCSVRALKPSQPYSAEFKLSVIKYIEEKDVTLLTAAVHFGISESAVSQWLIQYELYGLSSFYEGIEKAEKKRKRMKIKSSDKFPKRERSEKELLEELEYLRAENAYLKKLRTLVQERIARERKSGSKPSGN